MVPYSLGGMSVLPASSCKECEAVTSAFEGRCASVNYGSFRIRQNVRTRRPKKRPKQLPMISRDEGVDTVHLIPKEGVISTLPLFNLQPPGILANPPKKLPGWAGATLEVKTSAPEKPELWKNYSTPNFSVEQRFDILSHARMLAKIAHATAVGNLGLNAFNAWLPPYILGHDPCWSYLVGGFEGNRGPKHVLHEIKYEVCSSNIGFLVQVKIRLFAQFGGPHAIVIVGDSTSAMLKDRQPYVIGGNETNWGGL